MPGNLTRISQSSAESSGMEFWLSDVKWLGEDDDERDFTVYANKDVFLATFVSSGEDSSKGARQATISALAVFIPTDET